MNLKYISIASTYSQTQNTNMFTNLKYVHTAGTCSQTLNMFTLLEHVHKPKICSHCWRMFTDGLEAYSAHSGKPRIFCA